MLRYSLSLVAISLIFAASSLEAQTVSMGSGSSNQETNGDTNVLVQHHCSTSDEGLLRGKADLVGSYGQAARNMAEAEVYASQAREHELRNRQLVAAQYYERKEMFQASKSHSDKSTTTPYVTVSKNETPKAGTKVVGEDGRIHWPTAFLSDNCRSARQTIDIYFSHRGPGYSTGIGTPEFDTARAAIGDLTTNLKSRITEISSGDYVVASNFLKNLEKSAI